MGIVINLLNGLHKLKEAWTIINANFTSVKSNYDAHVAGTADKHATSKIDNDTVLSGSSLKQALDNLSITGTEHDALVTGALVDAESVDFGASGLATYLHGRLTKWENKVISHTAETMTYEGKKFTLDNPYKAGGSFHLKWQLHCHTTNSDGADTPLALATAYKNAGYNGLAITDHNVKTDDPGVAGLMFLVSVEETNHKHFCAYNITEQTAETEEQAIINYHRARSQIVSFAHPGWLPMYTNKIDTLKLYDYNLIEVFNKNAHYSENTFGEEQWDWALSNGQKVFATAVDDTHNIAAPTFNGGWVVIHTDVNSKEAVLESLRNGNFYASTGNDVSVVLDGKVLTASSTGLSNITFIGLNGKILQTNNGVTSAEYTIKGDEGYVRVKSVKVSDSTIAWSQPVFIDYYGGDGRIGSDTIRTIDEKFENYFGIYRQAIKNSGCQVAQNASATLSGTFQYGAVDMFAGKLSGAITAGTLQQLASSASISGYALRASGVTVDSAGKVHVRYRMESLDAKYYKNQIASFACKVLNDTTKQINYTITVRKASAADNFTTVTDIDTKTTSVSGGYATRIMLENIDMGDCSNGVEIEIVADCGEVTGKSFWFFDFQLNKGVEPLPYLPKSFDEEFMACQRYFEKNTKYSVAPANGVTRPALYGATAFAANDTRCQIPFQTLKRAVPTITFFRTTDGTADGKAAICTNNTTYVDATSTTSENVGDSGFAVRAPAAGLTAGYSYLMSVAWIADCRL